MRGNSSDESKSVFNTVFNHRQAVTVDRGNRRNVLIKRTIWPLLKCLVVVLAALAAASCVASVKNTKKSLPQSYHTILCESVDKFHNIGLPINAKENFTSDDKEIVAFLRIDNLTGEYNLSWDWYTPGGKLYRRSEKIPVTINNGEVCRMVTAWHLLKVSDDRVYLYPGQWTVKFKVNDEIIARKQFSFLNKS